MSEEETRDRPPVVGERNQKVRRYEQITETPTLTDVVGDQVSPLNRLAQAFNNAMARCREAGLQEVERERAVLTAELTAKYNQEREELIAEYNQERKTLENENEANLNTALSKQTTENKELLENAVGQLVAELEKMCAVTQDVHMREEYYGQDDTLDTAVSRGIRAGALDRGTMGRLGGLSGGGAAAGPLLKLLSGGGGSRQAIAALEEGAGTRLPETRRAINMFRYRE